jgi:hypothetical protein
VYGGASHRRTSGGQAVSDLAVTFEAKPVESLKVETLNFRIKTTTEMLPYLKHRA